MKRLQCTKCKQFFWTDLNQIDEEMIGEGEWIKNSCPRCRTEWAIVSMAHQHLGSDLQPPRHSRS